jgi:hypothetical protein
MGAQWKKEALQGKTKAVPHKVLEEPVYHDGYNYYPKPAPAVSTKPKKVAKAAEKAAAKKAEHDKAVAKFKETQKKWFTHSVSSGHTWFTDEMSWHKDMEELKKVAQNVAHGMQSVADAAAVLGTTLHSASEALPGHVLCTLKDKHGEIVEVVECSVGPDGVVKLPKAPPGGTVAFDSKWTPKPQKAPEEAPTGPEITLGSKVEAPPEDWVPKEPVELIHKTSSKKDELQTNVDKALSALSHEAGLMSPEQSAKFIDLLKNSPTLLDHVKSAPTNPLAKKLKLGKLMFGGKVMGTFYGTEVGLHEGEHVLPKPLLDKVGNEPEPQEVYNTAKGTDPIPVPHEYLYPLDVPALHTDHVMFHGKQFILGYLWPKGDLHVQFGAGYNVVIQAGNHPMTKVKWMFEQALKEMHATSPEWLGWADPVVASKLQILFALEPWYKPKVSWETSPFQHPKKKPEAPEMLIDYDYANMVYAFCIRDSTGEPYIGKISLDSMLADKAINKMYVQLGKPTFEDQMVFLFNKMVEQLPDAHALSSKQLFENFLKKVLHEL